MRWMFVPNVPLKVRDAKQVAQCHKANKTQS